MLKDLYLKPIYITTIDDIAKDFYTPCLKEAIEFDRIAGFFSSSALATYSEGLEVFCKHGAKYKLIISKEISEDDFFEIKQGYKLREEITEKMISSLDEKINLLEEKNISNFAYLLGLGIIDIKIAFCTTGMFHDKTGIFYDNNKNIVTFTGSNNETTNGIINNYEKFTIHISWDNQSDFYKDVISKNQEEFTKLWNNEHETVVVLPAQDVIIKKILTYNKGKIITDEVLLSKNAIIADYDKSFYLQFNDISLDNFVKSTFYKIRIRYKVAKITGNLIYFKQNESYLIIKKLLGYIGVYCKQNNFSFHITNKLTEYLNSKDLHIEQRRKIGINIKHLDNSILPAFNEYKKIVDSELDRKLRDKQMLDSFFMATMKKSANFSVPGSGKTSSALGVYAFYSAKKEINKIVVVGPKNSFGSWKTEFKNTFGNKKELKYFDEHELNNSSFTKIIKLLKYDSADINLFLFNYEALGKYEEFLMEFIDSKTLLIFDEVHKVKRVGGEYASHALNISRNAFYVITMTGTPIPNSYSDIYNMLHILFPDEYDDFFTFDPGKLDNPSDSDLEEINNSLFPFFCRTSKKELGVPPTNNDLFFSDEAAEEELQLYEILLSKYRKNKLALFIRLLQLESNPKMLLNSLEYRDFADILELDDENLDKSDYVDYSDDVKKLINKIDLTTKKKRAFKEICSILEENKKVILWCIFIDSIRSFEQLFSQTGYKVGCIYGNIPSQERDKILEDFRNGRIDILITNPHTLAESVSLHSVCHDAYYFEYSYNLVHLLQSKDRIHRLGLKEHQYTQYYYSMINFNTGVDSYSLDKAVYDRLIQKEQIMLDAIDHNILEPVTTSSEDLDLIFNDMF